MTSVILCGGQSSRMGSDKGLLKQDDKTWAQTAFEKMAALQLPVVISVNEQQYAGYAAVFSPGLLIKDDPSVEVKGPLLGLLSVHKHIPEEDLLVMACDMPLMQTQILELLLQHAEQNLSEDAVVFLNDGEPEPLCALYRRSGLQKTLESAVQHSLKKFSMKNMLEQLNVAYIPVTPEFKQAFRNINAHAELNGL